jgi:hypothetical protein
MNINLTHEESEAHFYNAICNGLGELKYYDLDLDYDAKEYKAAKQQLNNKQPDTQACWEDVLMEMLRSNNTLWIVDENDNERHPITLDLVHERVQQTPVNHLMNAINENDDATTADCIIQTVIYGEVIYG